MPALLRHRCSTDVVFISKHCLFESIETCKCFQNNASKLLLAIMESRHDSENAERILRNINPTQLVAVIEQAYTKVFDFYMS